jgi:hypothetical protein
MFRRSLSHVAIVAAVSVASEAQVTLSFSSPQMGQQLVPGSSVHWRIMCVDSGDNLGLAGISVDMVHDPSNQATFDLAPASSWPGRMNCFSRPDGISNAGPDGTGTGYGGIPVGPAGAKDLLEIGGMQNTFGFQGSVMGHDHTISAEPDTDRGIGQQGGGQLVAEGDFTVPSVEGVYRFNLQNGMANVFRSFGGSGQSSSVTPAEIVYGNVLWFYVGNCCTQDFNGDGDVNTDADIEAFFACVAGNCCPTCASADYNCDGDVGTDPDIESFFRVLAGGPC